ncbi:uncharacterized protein N7500_006397 [Penicillium coprophilum]|uniref:uncharacterized protein n=1 Tax=Penicillium coprophilum TaxID=36646 RepID=UPI002383E75F|nr:uncharacterized protein N7500_006397 [Penicillium coprophilum]KAJ5164567.1 hypothetical protein N7500_006397 [Penicillium coprophilum]
MTATGSEYLEVSTKGMQAYRAPSLLQPHKARQALLDAYEGRIGPLIGFYLAMPTIPTARIAAQLGLDFVWVDWEHSPCGIETMTNVTDCSPYLPKRVDGLRYSRLYTRSRNAAKGDAWHLVPGHEQSNISFALDAGASIVVPQVDTVEQAEHIISAAKYGAVRNGRRSAPPVRLIPGLSATAIDASRSIWENVNNQAAVIIQIESELGVKNLDAILTSVGDQVDAVWVGTLDLRVSMGLDELWGEEPEFQEVMRLYEETLKKHQKPNSGQCFHENWALGG